MMREVQATLDGRGVRSPFQVQRGPPLARGEEGFSGLRDPSPTPNPLNTEDPPRSAFSTVEAILNS